MGKVILADDHAITRSGIASLIKAEGWDIVAQAESFDTLVECLNEHETDIVISDCKMPGNGPVNLLVHTQNKHPNVKVIFLSGMESSLLYQQLIASNVNGLISKEDDPEDISKALTSVSKGNVYYSHSIKNILAATPDQLTPKEFQVFELITQGLSNSAIAVQLNNSPSTINIHRVNLMKKLNVNSVVELVKIAHRNGLFDS